MCSFNKHYQTKPSLHQNFSTFDWAKPAISNYSSAWHMARFSKLQCCCLASNSLTYFLSHICISLCIVPNGELFLKYHLTCSWLINNYILPLISWWNDFIMLSSRVINDPGVRACLNFVLTASRKSKTCLGFPISLAANL